MSYYQRPATQYRSTVFAAPAPRRMVARFDSVCTRCRLPIVGGADAILYTKGQPAVHAECPSDHGIEAPEVEAVAVAPVAPVARLTIEDAGVYKLADGAIVKVQANREKTRVYAKRLTEHKGIERATEGEAGERVHAEYVFEAGLIAQVEREGVKLTLEEAKALTIRYGFCIRCGRHLKAAQSVEQGMGPVCIRFFEGA